MFFLQWCQEARIVVLCWKYLHKGFPMRTHPWHFHHAMSWIAVTDTLKVHNCLAPTTIIFEGTRRITLVAFERIKLENIVYFMEFIFVLVKRHENIFIVKVNELITYTKSLWKLYTALHTYYILLCSAALLTSTALLLFPSSRGNLGLGGCVAVYVFQHEGWRPSARA